MKKDEIQNLVKNLIEKTTIKLNGISIAEDGPNNIFVSVEVGEPHFFVSREGEGLQALNHLVHRIIEAKTPADGTENKEMENKHDMNILVDINGFQKKRIENIRAIAHMMSERARYFKSNIEVDPMIKYIGTI
jgi:predicted RNA-binding protein Jag